MFDDLALVPRPREVRSLGTAPPAGGAVTERLDASLPAQGYVLRADAEGVALSHADDAGLRYGRATLEQLRAGLADGLPGFEIRDWPDFATRGYMLDVSRDRVPTRETLERLVEVLATARYNHLELYVEHTFAYEGHEAVWRDASPLTAEDLRWLDSVCARAGIELAGNQNCFGHMERWLRHPDYADRGECAGGNELLPGLVMPAMLLAPTDDNAKFAISLVEEQMAHLTSRRVNIGCDETFELGKGVSKDDVEARGREVVYLEHLKRIAEPLAAAGFDLLFWGDILRSHPALIAELPAGMTTIAWMYEAPRAPDDAITIPEALQTMLSSLGIDLSGMADGKGFSSHLAPFVGAGIPFWVAPGTGSWNSLVGRLDNGLGNLLDAAVEGRRAGASGFLVTDWGDNGHLQPPVVSVPPIVYGGAVSWCAAANAELDVPAVVDRHVFGDDAGVLAGVLDRVGRVWRQTGQQGMNGSPLQAALCPTQFQFVTGEPDVDKTGAVIDVLESALTDLPEAAPTASDGAIAVRELTLAIRLARHGAWRLRARASGEVVPNDVLRADLTELVAEYESCWLARSRPGGLADSVKHLRTTLAEYGG